MSSPISSSRLVTVPSFGIYHNPISTRGEQIMATLYWCPHQVSKIHISITSLAKTINALFMSLGDIWACICIDRSQNFPKETRDFRLYSVKYFTLRVFNTFELIQRNLIWNDKNCFYFLYYDYKYFNQDH